MSDMRKQILQARTVYREQHKCCPQCGNDKLRRTYVAYVLVLDKPFKDENVCTCKCGWSGIADNLKPQKENENHSDHRRFESCHPDTWERKGAWWASRASTPVWGVNRTPGRFDSYALPNDIVL